MSIKIPDKIFKKEIDYSQIYKCFEIITFFNYFKIKKIKNIFNGIDNKIYKRQSNGDLIQISNIIGCSFRIMGSNNTIIIDESSNFIDTRIYIWGDNNKLILNSNTSFNNVLFDFGTGCNNRLCEIEKNNSLMEWNIHIWGEKSKFRLGKNCLLSNKVTVLTSDGHKILDKFNNELINESRYRCVEIGEESWIGKNIILCKNTMLPPKTIVGTGSVVTKSFDETCCIIAGNPAKIIRKNVEYKK